MARSPRHRRQGRRRDRRSSCAMPTATTYPRARSAWCGCGGRRTNRSSTHRDPDKTASTHDGDFFTLGDMGWMDDDGYLFLSGRTAELIISGGVNIYPAEIDAVLLEHPAVARRRVRRRPRRRVGRSREGSRRVARRRRSDRRRRAGADRLHAVHASRTSSALDRSTSSTTSRASRPARSIAVSSATATGPDLAQPFWRQIPRISEVRDARTGQWSA